MVLVLVASAVPAAVAAAASEWSLIDLIFEEVTSGKRSSATTRRAAGLFVFSNP